MLQLFAADRWLPIFDSGYFDRMMDDIAYDRFSPEGMFLVVSFFGLFALALVVLLNIKTRNAHTVDLATSNWIIQRREIVALLQTAVFQRSKVRLSFHRDDKRSRSTDGAFVELGDNGFTLELASVRNLNRAWIGKLVDCDFRVKDKKSDFFNFYHFVSEIQDIRMGHDQILQLHVAIPLRLEASQKRSSLRIDPPDRLIPVFRVWSPSMVTSGKATDLDFATWGEPFFQIVPADMAGRGEIVDISGGGLGLEIEAGALDDGPHKLAPTDDLYIRMDLAEPGEDDVLTVYVLARVQIILTQTKVPGRHKLGLRFVRQGLPVDPKMTRLRWQVAEEDGIREVDDWVFARHLDIYRQRGGA
ncbi:MAG: hypothetical protein HQK81_12150 [Desulfovibrionaceae bacterium]|nr:hypothetical protein [Desulfovibrionaceae bacterium]MBF0514795.1 hypothetical protein [Desulfovibrionaceae bacterium]